LTAKVQKYPELQYQDSKKVPELHKMSLQFRQLYMYRAIGRNETIAHTTRAVIARVYKKFKQGKMTMGVSPKGYIFRSAGRREVFPSTGKLRWTWLRA
jgi:hypothetical protein